jgi:multidrug efflux pump subunit AcrA (membrane-fusion protein)
MAPRPYRLPKERVTASLGRFGILMLAVFLTAGLIYGAGALILTEGRVLTARLPSTADRTPSPAPTVAVIVVTPSPTPDPTASPTPSPTPSPPSIIASRYRSSGRNYVGLEVAADTTFPARFDGVIELRVYQFINGQVWTGSNVASLPFFPYVTVISSDRRMTYRPGALGSDTELLVRDGQHIAEGQSLFRVIGAGRSSWATFYDARAPYQVVVSLQTSGGRELDALSYFVDQ